MPVDTPSGDGQKKEGPPDLPHRDASPRTTSLDEVIVRQARQLLCRNKYLIQVGSADQKKVGAAHSRSFRSHEAMDLRGSQRSIQLARNREMCIAIHS